MYQCLHHLVWRFRFLWNVGSHLQDCTAWYSRRPRSQCSVLRKPQTSYRLKEVYVRFLCTCVCMSERDCPQRKQLKHITVCCCCTNNEEVTIRRAQVVTIFSKEDTAQASFWVTNMWNPQLPRKPCVVKTASTSVGKKRNSWTVS
jgi:hypothetical protein